MTAALAAARREVDAVLGLIEAGRHREAAERFVDRVALGPGSWARLPEPVRDIFEANAPTFLDEERDPVSRSVDAALAGTTVPMLFTHGTEGPPWYRTVIAELTLLVPNARVRAITGAGHIPHATHPEQWVATLLAFHQSLGSTEGRPGAGTRAEAALLGMEHGLVSPERGHVNGPAD